MWEKHIPLSVPNLAGNELAYVSEAVKTQWVSTVGSYVRDFEASMDRYLGLSDSVACQSGTAGLHIALMLAGVTAADAVLAPALTFIASVNPIRYIGATPLFMDCDDSLCLDPAKVERFCREECDMDGGHLRHRQTGKIVRAMVVVHVFGNMADMPALLAIARSYNIRIVEDATESQGTHYTDGTLDNAFTGTMGDVGVFSFNGNKIITTGGGGMIVSKDAQLLRHARHLTTQAKSDPINFKHDEVGYNYRLTNIQAALGLAQMEQLEGFIAIKQQNYDAYRRLLAAVPHVSLLPFREGTRSNRWFYSLYLEDGFPLTRDELIAAFDRRNIQTRPIWGLICDQVPYLSDLRYRVETARRYEQRVVSLPCSTNLTADDVYTVVAALTDAILAEGKTA